MAKTNEMAENLPPDNNFASYAKSNEQLEPKVKGISQKTAVSPAEEDGGSTRDDTIKRQNENSLVSPSRRQQVSLLFCTPTKENPFHHIVLPTPDHLQVLEQVAAYGTPVAQEFVTNQVPQLLPEVVEADDHGGQQIPHYQVPQKFPEVVVSEDHGGQQIPYEVIPEDPKQVLPNDDSDHPEVLQKVAIVHGTVDNVVFLGLQGNKHWKRKQLKNFFALVPGEKTVCVRSQANCSLAYLLTWILKDQNLSMGNPIITYRGRVCDLNTAELNDYPVKSLFLIFDGQVPDKFCNHSGMLWQCKVCGLAKVARKLLNKNCSKGNEHEFLFSGSHKDSWGHTSDNNKKLWALPIKHTGPGAAGEANDVDSLVPAR